MSEKKSNKLPLFYFVAGILITIYGTSQIDSINNINSEEHILPMLFIGLFGTWSLISFITLLKNGFFSFLKLKRFQFSLWITAIIIYGGSVYYDIVEKTPNLILGVDILCLFLSLILLGRVVWKILEDVGIEDGL